MKNLYKVALSALLILSCTSVTKATTYFYVSGALNTLSSWNTVQGGGGSAPTAFNGSSDVWNIYTSPSTALTVNLGINSNATVNIGDGTTAVSFTLSGSSGRFGTTQPNIVFNNNSTFYMQKANNLTTASKTTFNTGSLIIYSTNSGNGDVLADTYYNVQIDEDIGLNGNTVDVNGTLTVSSGIVLVVDASALNIHGTISGDGVISGDNSTSITFDGSGSIGTLNLSASGNTLNTLDVSLGSSSSTLILGENVVIDGGSLNLGGGNLDINGKLIEVSSNTGSSLDFTGGSFIGSSSSNLVVNNSVSGSVSFNSSANSLAGLVFNSSGNTMTLGNSLDIIDSVVVTSGTISSGGNLNIRSNSSTNLAARIGIFGSTGNISGNVNVETYFQAGATGWATLGATGINGKTVSDLDGQIPMTCQGCQYGVTMAGGYFESIQGYEASTCDMDTTITSSTALTPGRGFFIYLGTGSLTSAAMNWTLTGSVVSGAVNISTDHTFCTNGYTDGFNLLANPYASPIDVEKLINVGSNSGNFSGDFIQWSRNSTSWTNWNANSQTGSGSKIIPAGGAFLIDNTAMSTVNFSFDESAKSTSNGSSFLLSKGSSSSSTAKNQLKLKLKGQYDADEMLFLIHASATPGIDKYDSKKLVGSPSYGGGNYFYTKYTTLASVDQSSNKLLSLNTFPPSSKSATIPVVARVSISGTYTITATEFENFSSCAVLHDKLTGTYTDLKLNDYAFSISDTTQAPRFEIIICENGGAAVTLNEFYASDNISIGQDAEGPVVKTSFDKSTDAVISVYNLLGQKLSEDIRISGTYSSTSLGHLNLHGQVIMIKVTANDQSVTKKLLVN